MIAVQLHDRNINMYYGDLFIFSDGDTSDGEVINVCFLHSITISICKNSHS